MDLVQLIVSAGIGGVIVAFINAIANKRKLSAEATQIITQAASVTVENVVKDNKELREKVEKLETKVNELVEATHHYDALQRAWQQTEERYRWHLERWARYATTLSAELVRRGGNPEPPPPVFPDQVP